MSDPQRPIPDKTYFKIGEVARITGLEPHVLRYWETEFRQIRPEKSRSGHRLYRRENIERILEIRDLLYRQKFTIAGARRRLLHRHDQDAAEAEEERLVSRHQEVLREREQDNRALLQEVRRQLVEIRRRLNLG